VAAKGQRALTCGGCGGAAGRRNPARFGGGGEAGGGGGRERELSCAVLLLVWCRALRFRASERNGGERKERTDGLEADFIAVDCPYCSLRVDAANVAGPQSTVALGPSGSTVQ